MKAVTFGCLHGTANVPLVIDSLNEGGVTAVHEVKREKNARRAGVKDAAGEVSYLVVTDY